MKITVSRGPKKDEFEVTSDTTVLAFKKSFAQKNPKYYTDRQRFTINDSEGKKVVLADDKKSLSSYGVVDGSILAFKDLGPQVGYRTVFYVEYFGPIVFHSLVYFGRGFIYGPANPLSQVVPQIFPGGTVGAPAFEQSLLFGMVIAHFIKRELETMFVHKFSHGTMPISNLFKNSSHYWILGGLALALEIYSPKACITTNPALVYAALGLFVFSELSNLKTHLILSNLRAPGSTERKIPKGYGFDLVSCPNYFFEVLGWTAVTILTPGIISSTFLVVGAVQMWFWAVKKHKQYKKDFKDYPKRKVMFPFLF